MTICIYSVHNTINNKRYIGKTRNSRRRFASHRSLMKRSDHAGGINRYLWASAKKYGISTFKFEILEVFDSVNETLIGARELYWMDYFRTCDRNFGYNLRRDTSTGMVTHAETTRLKSKISRGINNPNYGNKWSNEQKKTMSLHARFRHTLGIYDESWRKKISTASSQMWSDDDKRLRMAVKVSENRRKFSFIQLTRCGLPLRFWDSVGEIIAAHPDWKWQNIYSVCNGYKHTYMGYVWRKVPRHD